MKTRFDWRQRYSARHAPGYTPRQQAVILALCLLCGVPALWLLTCLVLTLGGQAP